MVSASRPAIAVWGGVECTHNRVGDVWFDQLERSGHAGRPDDLDRFHALGLRTLRMPCLWERVAPHGPSSADWRWLDDRLARAQRLGLRPIAGLVHHGSGPASTSLIDDGFGRGLADYARAFARRYPWIDAYTPVNEPNTTARFSALYGHWYPHARSDAAYCRAVLVQCRAIVDAMRAIREITPGAQLIQTDDGGRTTATSRLAHQAAFESERRWLAWDLLFGRVDAAHPLRRWLKGCGVTDAELDWFRAHPCPPQIVGVNYYVTSDRYLDHDSARYPPHTHGGNGRERYADVEAVRSGASSMAGHEAVLTEAWRRYDAPVALTEVHLGCTREEQVRWLAAAWRGACAARDAGADVRAICVWALLGSHDWSSLVTRAGVSYEAGVFDVRGAAPRPTALAHAVREIVETGDVRRPHLAAGGWWTRDTRVTLGPPAVAARPPAEASAPLLVVGGPGALTDLFLERCRDRGLAARRVWPETFDGAASTVVADFVARERPWAIVCTPGVDDPDAAERRPAACWRDNVALVATLCRVAAAAGLPLVTFSSDLVFDGRLSRAYVEADAPGPLSVLGRARAAAERIALDSDARVLVIRTGPLFDPRDPRHFAARGLRALMAGRRWRAADDEVRSPAYTPHVVDATLDLLIDEEVGLWHLANAGSRISSLLACELAEACRLDRRLVAPCPARALKRRAARPRQSALTSMRGVLLPTLQQAVDEYAARSIAVDALR